MPSGRGPLRTAVEDWVRTYSLPQDTRRRITGWLDQKEAETFKLLGDQMARYGVPAALRNEIMATLSSREPGQAPQLLIAAVVMVVGLVVGILQGFTTPISRMFTQKGNDTFRNELMGVSELAESAWRGYIPDDVFHQRMAWHGFDTVDANTLRDLGRRRLSPDQAILMVWRGVWSIDQFRAYLKSSGWPSDELVHWEEMTHNYAGIQDVIRWAVRDAFNEEVVRKYGYDEDYPGAVLEAYAAKQGYSKDQVLRWWRSHFQLPSPQQGAEMVQRGVISRDDYETLLRIADYPKFWRDKLIQITYSPFTRVDIRRMFNVGVLTYDQMVVAYKDIGYDDIKARQLADFTVALKQEPEKDLSRGDILAAYHDHAQSRDETIQSLEALGYDARESGVLIARVDAQLQDERVKEEIEFYHQSYLSNAVTEVQVAGQLTGLGLSSVKIQALLQRWGRERAVTPKIPSRAEAHRFVTLGVITLDEYRTYLQSLGYSVTYVDWFVREAQQDLLKG